ncbi:MAG: hypothetical protein FWG02_11710 [Holophagaceae bacterium]|nr:hypothetical protein [Holophagaceae bacterium]
MTIVIDTDTLPGKLTEMLGTKKVQAVRLGEEVRLIPLLPDSAQNWSIFGMGKNNPIDIDEFLAEKQSEIMDEE